MGFSEGGRGFRVRGGGKTIELSPFSFSSAQSTGARVLAVQGDRVWQSSDYGWTFTEVARPPLPGGLSLRACSAVGCLVSEFARIGWPASTPSPEEPRRLHGFAQAPPEPRAARPILRCTSAGPSTRKALPPGDARFGFGAQTLQPAPNLAVTVYPRGVRHPGSADLEAANLRALRVGRIAEVAPDGSLPLQRQPDRIRLIDPFEPKGSVRDVTIRPSDLLDAARATGGQPPDLGTPEDRDFSTIVAGDPPSTLLGAGEGAMIWVRAKAAPLALSLGAALRDGVVSAVQTGTEEVTVLVAFDDGMSARALGRGRAGEVFAMPHPPEVATPPAPDALAIGPDAKLAVIRVTTRHPPTAEQPALLLRPGEPPVALAPWSTVAAGGTPPCEGMQGHRAVIVTTEPWLDLGGGEEPFADRVGFALVRWSTDRVCLDAIELPAHGFDLASGTVDSYMAVRFGKDAGAGHLLVAEGAELREPRSCEITR